MAKLIVVNTYACSECGQPTGWKWRIEYPWNYSPLKIEYDFKYRTKETAIIGGTAYANTLGIVIDDIDKRRKNLNENNP